MNRASGPERNARREANAWRVPSSVRSAFRVVEQRRRSNISQRNRRERLVSDSLDFRFGVVCGR